MTQEKLLFRLAARCEAAGRPNNEDNYQLDEDLSDDIWGFKADEENELRDKGALLVVCDGMGGMNAGEVASAVAVATIKEWFAAERLTPDVLNNPKSYIRDAIVAADAAIKQHEQEHPETEGMGSTIVMAWLLNRKVYVGWCGDSRCYCYNAVSGLMRLSKDHSYVQELIDAGKLTEELAFDHPNSNIITRSLGDPRGKARPDVKEYDLHNGDILLLCSDGLCGCLRDEEIMAQIAAHPSSMQECRDALWVADEAAGWHDNVTIALAQIISGGEPAVAVTEDNKDTIQAENSKLQAANNRLKMILIAIVVLVVLAPLAYFGAKAWFDPAKEEPVANDSIMVENAVQDTAIQAINEDKEVKIAEKAKPIEKTKPTEKVQPKEEIQPVAPTPKPIEEIPEVVEDELTPVNTEALDTIKQ